MVHIADTWTLTMLDTGMVGLWNPSEYFFISIRLCSKKNVYNPILEIERT